MTKEEAIDIIKCLAWYTRPNEEDIEQAIKALEQEPCIPTRDLSDKELKHFAEEMKKVRPQVIEQEPRWIPVSERLPEYDEDIIITHKGTMGQPITSVSYFDGDFRTEDGEGYFSDVIAWMPLPEPYKAESEE